MSEHISPENGNTTENQNQLRVAVEQLKQAVSQCLGKEHDCNALIAQIEGTISDIEQKTTFVEEPIKTLKTDEGLTSPAAASVLQTVSTIN